MDWELRVRACLGRVTGDAGRDAEIRAELIAYLIDREAELLESGHDTHTVAALLEAELAETIAAQSSLRHAAVAPFAKGTPMHFWNDLAQDLRYATRMLRRTPGFTLVALLTLALAIGATTAIFSVARGVLLRPLPYPEPDSIVRIWEVTREGEDHNVVSSGNYLDWRDRATSFSAIGALSHLSDRAMTGNGEPLKVVTAAISPSVLDVLQVSPRLGRGFTSDEGAANAPGAAVLSYRFWQNRFSGDPSIVGRTITLDATPYTIAGVMPDGFAFPAPGVDLLINLRFGEEDRAERRSHNLVVIARLARGTSRAGAGAEMRAIASQLAIEHPAHMQGWSVNVVPLHEDAVRTVRPLVSVLTGVVLAVLLIACANLANLQLARASRRSHEMAVRAAIGAGRGRMFRQMLTETSVLAAAGGALGLGVAAAAVRVIVAAAPADIPFMERVAIDPAVLGAAAGATIFSALVMGLAPAIRAGRPDLRPALQSTAMRPDRGQQRLRQALLVAQVSLALVLLVSAALLARSFWQLNQVEHGYDPRGILTVQVDLPRVRYADPAAQRRFYDQVIERLSSNPKVEAVAGTTGTPGSGSGMTFSFAIEGRPSSNPSGRETAVPLQGVTGDYFSAMRIPVLAGRAFTGEDRPDTAPVIVINEALARRHWPDGGAVGARINFRPGELPWMDIVGIAGDTRDEGLAEDAPPTIYVPFAQRAASWRWMTWQTLVVRARSGAPEALVPDVRAAVWAIDPNLPLLDVATAEDLLAENEARRRMAAGMVGAFAMLALLLGTIGVYGVMSYSVAEQRQEIGLRIALGAAPSSVARRIVRGGVGLAAAGVAIGLAVAAVVTAGLETLLYEIEPLDIPTFAAMSVLLLAVAALAAWLPARRAMRIDPITVLRER